MSNPSPFDFLYDIPRVDFCAEGLHYLPCVRYARENPRQYMDCIFKDGLDQYPVLVWVHGGGWGDEYNTPCYRPEPTLLELANRGWFIACIEYRLAQHGAFPIPMLDCQKAVAWLRENADRFHLDPGLFAIWGESAGAHLACMVGANYNKMKNADVQAIVSWYCPSDLASEIESRQDLAEDSFYTEFLGRDLSQWRKLSIEASPITYASSPMPPVLLMHGDADELVDYDQSVRYCEALREAGNVAELVTVHGQGHGFFTGQEYYDRIVQFLEGKRRT